MTASQVARVLIRVGGAMMALVLPAMERVQKRIVYHPSDRVARGRYRIAPDVGPDFLRPNTIVLARLLMPSAHSQRSYLPSGVPILKRAAVVA